MKNSNECDINDLFLKLKSQLLVWQDSSFEQFLKIEKEEDNFLDKSIGSCRRSYKMQMWK